MAAPYKPRQPGSLKQAIALLVEKCGGQTAVAGLWKCSPQNVARMSDDGSPQNPPRIDQILILEALCREPVVTRFMAGEVNCIVEPVNCGIREPLALIMGKITSETGELLSAAAMSVASGRMTPANAAIVLRETDDVVCALVDLRGDCRAVLKGGA